MMNFMRQNIVMKIGIVHRLEMTQTIGEVISQRNVNGLLPILITEHIQAHMEISNNVLRKKIVKAYIILPPNMESYHIVLYVISEDIGIIIIDG